MLGECRGLYTISRTVSARLREVQRARLDAALPSAAHGAAARRPASTATTCCRSRGSRRTSASISPSARWRTCRRTCGSSSSAKAATARCIEQAAEETRRRAIASRLPARSATTSWSRSIATRCASSTCRSTRTTGSRRSKRSWRRSRSITARDSGGTLEFVRDGDNGFVVDPDPEAIAGGDRTARRRSRARARRSAPPAASSPRRSPGTRVIERLLSHG